MVRAVRQGGGLREVAREYRVDPATVRLWYERARGQRLDRVDFGDRPPGRRQAGNRIASQTEELILQIRSQLKESSDLGHYGAQAILQALESQGLDRAPSLRTVGRVLSRRGAVDRRYRIRRPPPPPGWYLPAVGQGREELDSFDIVEGLAIKGGLHFELLNGISLHGALSQTHLLERGYSAKTALEAILAHWRQNGLPGYAQFDNDTRFQGPHSRRHVISRVMRLCLSLGVVPVFAPPRETGFQAAIESFNGLWQAKVWRRFTFGSLVEVTAQSERFHAARRIHLRARIEQAPPRKPFPSDWKLQLQAKPRGRIIFLRRTDETGHVQLLGQRLFADSHWLHRLIRCEVDLDKTEVRCFALRRRNPTQQPLLCRTPFRVPHKRFHE